MRSPSSSMKSSPSSTRSMMTTSTRILRSLPATSPPNLPDDGKYALRERTLETQTETHKRYRPYKPRVIPPALELRFASKSIGDTSFSDLGFEDVVEGRCLFVRGLSCFSDSVIKKAYIAKSTFRDSILRRIMLCQSNIDVAETRKDMFLAMKVEAEDVLKSADEEVEWVKEVLRMRDVDLDDVAFHHAAYADDLVALTIADMQLEQMASVLQKDGSEKVSDSDETDMGSDEDDDLVYKDSKRAG